jgi:hypothetical protein
MRITLSVLDGDAAPAPISYHWDADTDILGAEVRGADSGDTGLTGIVEIEGRDGSWLNIEVRAGRIVGVEVAVWPDVKIVPSLAAPATVAGARVVVPARRSQPGIASVELDAHLSAEADATERTVHFRIGQGRAAASYRAAADLVVDVDESQHLAGIWLLNVPPFPSAP